MAVIAGVHRLSERTHTSALRRSVSACAWTDGCGAAPAAAAAAAAARTAAGAVLHCTGCQ